MKDATAMDVEIEQQDIFNTQIHGFTPMELSFGLKKT
jgi:hypothetical protein